MRSYTTSLALSMARTACTCSTFTARARKTSAESARPTWRTRFLVASTSAISPGHGRRWKRSSGRMTWCSSWARVTSSSWAMTWRTRSSLAWLRGLAGVKEDEALASRTSFGIGGPAAVFLELARPEAIAQAVHGRKNRAHSHLLLRAGNHPLLAGREVDGVL